MFQIHPGLLLVSPNPGCGSGTEDVGKHSQKLDRTFQAMHCQSGIDVSTMWKSQPFSGHILHCSSTLPW
ncbi:hypothetical protein ACRRTK_005059 [Alexandromys fortis]